MGMPSHLRFSSLWPFASSPKSPRSAKLAAWAEVNGRVLCCRSQGVCWLHVEVERRLPRQWAEASAELQERPLWAEVLMKLRAVVLEEQPRVARALAALLVTRLAGLPALRRPVGLGLAVVAGPEEKQTQLVALARRAEP